MNDINDKVLISKNALMSALGDLTPKYLANMKMWFRHKWTKEEFDYESRKLLSANKIHLHNQFLLAILNKIDTYQIQQYQHLTTPIDSGITFQTLGTSGGSNLSLDSSNNHNNTKKAKRKKISRLCSDRMTFEPYDVLDFIAEDNMKCIRPAVGTDANFQIMPNQRYCVQELFLPDTGFIMGRFLIGAWELGLVNVEDSVAEYMAVAVQVLLKNILSTIIMKRQHYRVTGEGSFYYDVGAPLKDPFVRNTVTRQKIDDSPLELDKEITSPNFMRRTTDETVFLSACEAAERSSVSTVITLKECQRAFADRNLIASHSVYALNIERLTQMMH